MAIKIPQTRLVPGAALRTATEQRMAGYGEEPGSATGSALREIVTPPIIQKEPRGSEKVFSVRPEVSQETLPGSGIPENMPGGSMQGLPTADEASAIIRNAIDGVISPRGLDTSPTRSPGRSVLGPSHIGGTGFDETLLPSEEQFTPVEDQGFNNTDLGKRLATMATEGKGQSTSKKFAKLYNRYQTGGTTVTGHKTEQEMNEAGARQQARRDTEAAAVARMNEDPTQRESGSVLSASVPRLTPSTVLSAAPQTGGVGGAMSPELERIMSESTAEQDPIKARINELERQIQENAGILPSDEELDALIGKFKSDSMGNEVAAREFRRKTMGEEKARQYEEELAKAKTGKSGVIRTGF